ncbi:MAG: zinc ribbon domain-containing protein [Desulfobacterales bacterium]
MLTFETREEAFERVISLKKPRCKYCGQEMSLWEVPDINVSDGLGWGTPWLFVCFNDECSLYAGGWKNLQENYGRTGSYRCICYPGTENYESMSVWSSMGGQGQIIDEEVLARRKLINEKTAKGMADLENFSQAGDSAAVLSVLLDANEPAGVRLKAAVILGEIGDTDSVDPLRNHSFGNETLRKKMEEAIEKIHQRHFTRECPFCAEIIKQQAKICKHCGREMKNSQ